MKILILGGSGMLGHRLWYNLGKKHEVWVTIRGDRNPFPGSHQFPSDRIRYRVDALIFHEVTRALASIQPDLVINSIGLIKQMGHLAMDPLFSISLNSLLPHHVSLICRTANIRMIHISTDCVFSGRKGSYTEDDQSDAEDLYGRTKFLGEVHYPHAITLRTSIIGQELKSHRGLIDWFLSQTENVYGYQNAIYTGFTTDELSRIIMEYVIPNPNLSGLFHISSDTISKYDLLKLVRDAYSKDIDILADQEFVCDRSLDSTRFRMATGYEPPSWEEMIDDLASNASFYERNKWKYLPEHR